MGVFTPGMEHQLEIVNFSKDKPYVGIFAEYGTGKTWCILKLAEILQVSKVLVTCSKTAILATWPLEISKHSDFNYVYLTGTKQQRLNALALGLRKSRAPETMYSSEYLRPTFFLINFDGIASIYNELVASNFDILAVDESTKIKYPNTKRTKVVWALGKNIPRKYILTGFPITENTKDLYSQIKFLDRGATFGNSYYAFLDKYYVKFGYKLAPKKGSTEEILKKIEPFCIRVTNERLKLPPKRYHVVGIEATDEQKRYLKDLKTTMQLSVGSVNVDTEYIFTLLTKSLEICDGFIQDSWYNKVNLEDKQKDYCVLTCTKCGYSEVRERKKSAPSKCPKCFHMGNVELIPTNKDDYLLDLLEEIEVDYNKVLIWTPFLMTIVKLKKLLQTKGYNVLTLTGETEDVKGTVDKFMTSKNHNILILTEKKGAESLNLTNCRTAIYYSNEWSYDRRANSEARIYRKGSEIHQSVIYIDFLIKGTVEESVVTCLKTKKDLVDTLKEQFRQMKQEANTNV
jgi:SNF2 family DNA or RNA helicase